MFVVWHLIRSKNAYSERGTHRPSTAPVQRGAVYLSSEAAKQIQTRRRRHSIGSGTATAKQWHWQCIGNVLSIETRRRWLWQRQWHSIGTGIVLFCSVVS